MDMIGIDIVQQWNSLCDGESKGEDEDDEKEGEETESTRDDVNLGLQVQLTLNADNICINGKNLSVITHHRFFIPLPYHIH